MSVSILFSIFTYPSGQLFDDGRDTGTPVHRYTGTPGRPSDGLVKVVVRTNFCVPLGPRAAGGGPSGTQKLINKKFLKRKPGENLAKT